METTSLAILAWLDDPAHAGRVTRAVEFLLAQRRGGTFGATQATIQALRALTQYAEHSRRIPRAGEVRVLVDGELAETLAFEAGHRGALEVEGLAERLRPGTSRVRLELAGGNELPWSLDVRYTSERPADDPDAPLALRAALARPVVEEGESVALDVEVENLGDEGRPMTIAVVGLPAGLDAPTEVLDDLQEAGRFALWELRGNELALYWRDMAPRQVRRVTLDLVARIPGTTTGPASRAYLYYTPSALRWAEPLTVEVTPLR